MPVNRALVRVLTVIACLGWAIVVVADIHGTGSTDLTAGRLGLRTGEAAMLALALFAVGPPASAGRRFAAATLGISAGAALLAWTVDFLHGFANLCVGMMCDANPPLPGEPDWEASVVHMGWLGVGSLVVAAAMLVIATFAGRRAAAPDH